MDDNKILLLIYNKDESAITRLEYKYKVLALRVAFNIVGSKEDAEECVNDAFLNIWNYEDVLHIKSLEGFICSCVRRRAIDFIRHETAKKRGKNIGDILLELNDICDPITTDDMVDNNELSGLINKYILNLKPIDKSIFILRYFHCKSIEEISKYQNKSRSSIDNRLYKMRKELKVYLKQNIISEI